VHSFEMVLIEEIVKVTEDGAPVFVMASELVAMEGDVVPVTSTRCPK
jgi:hypothetical protein